MTREDRELAGVGTMEGGGRLAPAMRESCKLAGGWPHHQSAYLAYLTCPSIPILSRAVLKLSYS